MKTFTIIGLAGSELKKKGKVTPNDLGKTQIFARKRDKMGRRPWSDRRMVEECGALDVSTMVTKEVLDLSKVKYLKLPPFRYQWTDLWGREVASIDYEIKRSQTGSLYLQLSYTIPFFFRGEEISYPVELTTTPCNFGGVRYWFICPLEVNGKACGRRVGKLYRPSEKRYFGCRTCYNLTYKSCKEHNVKVDLGKILR